MSGSILPKNSRPLVCIVADDISIRESLSSLLRSAGLNVEIFSSAEEFLSSAHFEALGCLIVDVQPGVAGLDLQQELVRRQIKIPTIFLTGYDDSSSEVGAAKPGAVECFTKPLDDEYLLETVWSAIRSYISGRPVREGNTQIDLGGFNPTSDRSDILPPQA
jgi:FixJ family two-component response regulator